MLNIRSNRFINILAIIYGFVIPLLYFPLTNEQYEFTKITVFYITTAIFFVFAQIYQKFDFKINRYMLFFLVSNIITFVFSTHLYTSFYGYYLRFNGGLQSILCLIIFYKLISTYKIQDKILYFTSLTAFPISTLALYQYYFLNKVRVFSTQGQPNWLGAYLMIILILNFNLYLKKSLKIFYFSTILAFWSLWLTHSLSAILATVISFLAFTILNFDKIKNKTIDFLLLLLSFFIIVIFNHNYLASRIDDVKQDLNNPNTVTSNNKISDSTFIRLNIAKDSINLFTKDLKTILIGTGQETFAYEYQKFRSPNLNLSSEWDYILNKPHNYYIELLVENGLIGLITYIILFLVVFKNSTRLAKSILIGISIINLFSWPTITQDIIFFTLISKGLNNNVQGA